MRGITELVCSLCFVYVNCVMKGDYNLDVTMPGLVPSQDEQYSCTSTPVTDEGYIVGYKAVASIDRVHHMILFGCSEPAQATPNWQCMGGTCRGRSKILWAWARNAPPFELPDGVGFHIGGDSGINHLVVQVHYAKKFDGNVEDYSGVSTVIQAGQPPNLASIYLFASGMPPIPPDTPTYFMNMSCTFRKTTPDQPNIYAFAFRTHTHDLGRVVSAFKIHNGKWTMIGKRNPLWPQMFQRIEKPLEIEPGDGLAAQCRFNSTGRHEKTSIGAHGHNEMCNFYMMYYRDSKSVDPFDRGYSGCGMPAREAISNAYPSEGSDLLPRRLELEEVASLNSHNFVRYHRSRTARDYGYEPREPIPYARGRLNYPDYDQPPIAPSYTNARKWKEDLSLVKGKPASKSAPVAPVTGGGIHLQAAGVSRVVEKWTANEIGGVKLGQVAGLAVGDKAQLYIFHRADRVWDATTFTDSNELRVKQPIALDVILVVESSSAPKLLAVYGKGLFYMPHGIFVDQKGNIWTTDTGSHQVKRYKISGNTLKETGSWGELLVSGSDQTHFCQPSAVAVTSTGQFFVADGYCNNRIVHFNADGSFKMSIGQRTREMPPALGSFILPHDITLHEQMSHIHVADRDNGRMQMLYFNGTPIYQLAPPPEFETVYSVDYCPKMKLVFVLPGEPPNREGGMIRAFAIDAEQGGHVKYSFAPSSTDFKRPHIIRLSADCSEMYVSDLGDDENGAVYKFQLRSKSVQSPAVQNNATKAGEQKAAPALPTKPTEAGGDVFGRQGAGKLWVALASVFALTSLFVLLLCVCLKFKKQGGFKSANVRTVGDSRFGSSARKLLNGKSFKDSREGFMPLPTADIDAVDDLTDDSDMEDTLYASNHNTSAPRRT